MHIKKKNNLEIIPVKNIRNTERKVIVFVKREMRLVITWKVNAAI